MFCQTFPPIADKVCAVLFHPEGFSSLMSLDEAEGPVEEVLLVEVAMEHGVVTCAVLMVAGLLRQPASRQGHLAELQGHLAGNLAKEMNLLHGPWSCVYLLHLVTEEKLD